MNNHDSWKIIKFLWTVMTHEQSWLLKIYIFLWKSMIFCDDFMTENMTFRGHFFGQKHIFSELIFWSKTHFSGMIPGSFWHHSGIIQGSSRHHFKLVLGDFRVIFRSEKSRPQNRRRMIGASCRSCLVLFPPSPLIKKRHFFTTYWSKKWYATGTGN